MHLMSLFGPLENLERSLMTFYQQLSERFADVPEASRFFSRLSRDESNHLKLVQHEKWVVRQNPKLFSEVDVDLAEVIQMTAEINQLIQEEREWTLREAVAEALRFELSSAEHHYKGAMDTANKSFADFLRKLGAADENHLKDLQELGRREGLIGLDEIEDLPSTQYDGD